MRKNPARKLPARKLLASFIAGALFIPNMGFTLGLGEIEVNSALNQKLNADIELLSATPEDGENLIVKLASRKEFSRAGLDRPYLLNDLHFKATTVDGTPHIKVTSGGPIREPFLNFLVEIDWPNGHMIREYTVLLDPPVFMTQGASTASAPNNQAATANNGGFRPSSSGTVVPVVTPVGVSAASSRPQAAGQPVKQQGATTSPATNPAFVPAPVLQQTAVNQPAGSYRIKSGDTAWSLADAMRPDQSVSVEQMMIAMLRSNPESFINENINGLKRGYILRVPDYDQVTAVSHQDARALVREQAALWRQFQQTQAGGQPVSAMPSDAGGDAGTADGSAAGDDSAYLEIVSAGSGSSTMSGKDPTQMTPEELRAELALARERVETEKVEKEALQRRIDELERSTGASEGLMSIEDDQLSDVQALGDDASAEADGGTALDAEAERELQATLAELSGDAEPAADDSVDSEAIESEAIESEAMEGDAAEVTDAEATGLESVEPEDAVFVDEAEDGATEVVEDEVASEPLQESLPAESPIVERAKPADPLSQLLNDPMMMAAAGGGLLLVVALIGLFIKRRKAAAEADEPVVNGFDDIESIADDVAEDTSAEEEKTLAGDQAENPEGGDVDKQADDFDSDATTILDATEDTVVTEAPDAAAEEEPRDDVIAEADVYLAYGIYQQAEELLTQAIKDQPERDDYRLKLAETHYASKNASGFMDVANEIKDKADGDDNPIWKKILVMGQDLCPDEMMFQGSMVSGLDIDSMAPKVPEMDFDLGMDSAGENGDNNALDFDDSELELPEMEKVESAADEGTAEPADELEFDLSDTGAMQAVPEVEDEFSLDIDATELDIDIQEETEESVVAEDDEVHDVADIDFGLDEVKAAEADSTEEEISLDLTDEAEAFDLGIDEDTSADDKADSDEAVTLDIDTPDEAPADEEKPEPASSDDADSDDFDLSSLDDVDEISTKLDLARAYLDMGDHEGTREILEEVLADGNDEQKQEASELMGKLD